MNRTRALVSVASLILIAGMPAAEVAGADWTTAPVVPKLSGQLRGRLVATLRKGRRLGNRGDVFAKVGDSLSASAAFAEGLGCGRWTAPRRLRIRTIVRRFSQRSLSGASTYCHRVNSFSRDSVATRSGKISAWALQPGAAEDPSCRPGESPLACEIRLTRPAFAFILFGTNDLALALALGTDPAPGYVANMTRIVRSARARGVVPILSTIPRFARDPGSDPAVDSINAAVTGLAGRMRVPLMNLWRALEPLPGSGLAADGVHLSIFRGPGCIRTCDPNTCAPACQPANLTPAGLTHGYNVRNLITVLALSRLSSVERALSIRRRPND